MVKEPWSNRVAPARGIMRVKDKKERGSLGWTVVVGKRGDTDNTDIAEFHGFILIVVDIKPNHHEGISLYGRLDLNIFNQQQREAKLEKPS